MRKRECFRANLAGYDIVLTQTGKDSFGVQYGAQYTYQMPYAEAAKELGYCIFHALRCEGKFD